MSKSSTPLFLPLLLILFGFIICLPCRAQRTEIFASRIATVQLLMNGEFDSDPIIKLGGEEYLEFSFDELSHEYKRYIYEIEHCDANYELSQISQFDFMDGFSTNYINDYATSINTTVDYTHYRLEIPNEDITLKVSGNYRITVFDEEDRHTPILRSYFSIVDDKVGIDAKVSSNTTIDNNKGHQQVSFTVNHRGYQLRNPQQNIKVRVMQNGRTDNSVTGIVPTYILADQLKYEHNTALIFSAGNEYRRFETVSQRHLGIGIDRFEYFAPFYHATLFEDNARINTYSYNQDQNGHFLIRYDDAIDNSNEADYFFVHFLLDLDSPFRSGNVYLEGAFTYDNFNTSTEMRFNPDTHCYESVQLLKQGSYNYQYLYVPEASTKGETGPIEGNYSETENEYLILVYYATPGERYDQLIGTKKIHFRP